MALFNSVRITITMDELEGYDSLASTSGCYMMCVSEGLIRGVIMVTPAVYAILNGGSGENMQQEVIAFLRDLEVNELATNQWFKCDMSVA